MSRICKHLLAWLSVAAFLFANAHTSSALASLVHPPKAPTAASPTKRTCCSHCRARQPKPAVPKTDQIAVSATNSDHGGCPCCPGPSSCPDGCVVCNIAKTLVTVTTPVVCESVPVSIDAWADPIQLHLTAFHGELMRPPRS